MKKINLSFLLLSFLLESNALNYRFQEWQRVPDQTKVMSFWGRKEYSFLSQKCDSDPKCVAFDSNGNLLSSTVGSQYDQTASLFIKDSTLNQTSYLPINVWPYPSSVSTQNTEITISPLLTLKTSSTSSILLKAWKRYQKIIFSQNFYEDSFVAPQLQPAFAVSSLTIEIKRSDEALQLETDQSYNLEISSNGIKINSNTVYGAMYGLETLSQLIKYNYNKAIYLVKSTPILIRDSPSFLHRGMLLDTSRHYIPVSQLKTVLDSLSYAKMNVFHWHIVDAQSFPLESKTYPKLWQGAWNPTEKYTSNDVLFIVKYAKERGIRVIPEFDGPGHAWAWGVGYPELLPEGWATAKSCSNVCPSNPCNVPLDPTSPSTYPLLKGLYNEFKNVFPDEFLHLGGDEVEQGCWNNSRRIAQYIAKKKISLDGLYEEFVQKVHTLAFETGKIPINWEEVFRHFGSKLDKRIINHAWWSGAEFVLNSTSHGYRTLSSQGWYLDHWTDTWSTWYQHDPISLIRGNPSLEKLYLGGESAMWGERMTSSNLFHLVWPKNGAVAERLWNDPISGPGLGKVERALPRLHEFKCTLERRGINADPVYSWDYAQYPSACLDS